ncbi:MAG: cation:proton antiporter regulatory subunit, partial [Thermoplasmatota archaeon]
RYPWGVRFAAVAVPRGSPVAGQSVAKARIGELTGATVAVLQRGRHESVDPGPDEVLMVGDTLVLMGEMHQLARAEALVVAHGEAIRLTAQSRLATVEEVTVVPGSRLAGAVLDAAHVRAHSGALVAGVWRRDASHPEAYRPAIQLDPGDRLIVLGSTLQRARARELAQEPWGAPGWGEV